MFRCAAAVHLMDSTASTFFAAKPRVPPPDGLRAGPLLQELILRRPGSALSVDGLHTATARAMLDLTVQEQISMPVDMLLARFFEEVDRLYPETQPFARTGCEDSTIAKMPLPTYQAVFGACLVFQHAAGYHLPDFDTFVRTFCDSLKVRMDRGETRWAKLFEDAGRCTQPVPGFRHRLGGFYINGMAHTHLYATLVQAYEDQRRIGAVLWDPRVDWKLKTDLVVLTPWRAVRIDIHGGSEEVIASRADQERETKAAAGASSHEGNPFYDKTRVVRALSHSPHVEERHGLWFLSAAHINDVIAQVDAALGVPKKLAIRYESMVEVEMRDLMRMRANGLIQTFDGVSQGGDAG